MGLCEHNVTRYKSVHDALVFLSMWPTRHNGLALAPPEVHGCDNVLYGVAVQYTDSKISRCSLTL